MFEITYLYAQNKTEYTVLTFTFRTGKLITDR